MKRTTGRWRDASQASCDHLAPRKPLVDGALATLGISQSSPVADGAGAVERADYHTKHPWPSGSWLPPRSATTPSHGRIHDAPVPRPRGLSVIALSPVADVGPARHASRGNVLQDQLAQQQPRGHLGGDRGSGRAGESGARSRGWPRPDFDPPAGSTI